MSSASTEQDLFIADLLGQVQALDRALQRREDLIALLAGFSSGAVVGAIMWLAIQLFHP